MDDGSAAHGSALSRSKLIRLFVDGDAGLESHDVTISAPFSAECDLTSVLIQMTRDGLQIPIVEMKLHHWAEDQDDVRQISIRHTGQRYQLGVLLDEHTQDRFIEVDGEVAELAQELFGDARIATYVFGPGRADDDLFCTRQSWKVYPSNADSQSATG